MTHSQFLSYICMNKLLFLLMLRIIAVKIVMIYLQGSTERGRLNESLQRGPGGHMLIDIVAHICPVH